MDISTGVFTAPKAGIYHFSFSINKEAKHFFKIHFTFTFELTQSKRVWRSLFPFTASAVLQSTLQLEKGGRVDV